MGEYWNRCYPSDCSENSEFGERNAYWKKPYLRERVIPLCRCGPGPCGLDHPVRYCCNALEPTEVLPYGEYLWCDLKTWEEIPRRLKLILSKSMLQVWKTHFQEKAGGLTLPEGCELGAIEDEPRYRFEELIKMTFNYLEWNYDHDFCCHEVTDMFLTRDFEKVVVQRKILALQTELKLLKRKEKLRRQLAY